MDRAEKDKLEWIEWLRAEREKRGWSQQLLAEKAGTTRQTINDYEEYRRVKHPDGLILANISLIFGEADDYLPRLAGLLPPPEDGQDPWVKKMNAKLRRIPIHNRDAADRMIESLAEKDVEPREIKRKPKTKTKPSTS